jgi:ABC-type amino acid transport substrate-binding protein
MLTEQKVVATYQDSAQTDYFIKQRSGLFEVGGGVMDANLEGIVVRKDNTVLLNSIYATFRSLVSDGTYHRIVGHWGLTSGEIGSAEVGIT